MRGAGDFESPDIGPSFVGASILAPSDAAPVNPRPSEDAPQGVASSDFGDMIDPAANARYHGESTRHFPALHTLMIQGCTSDAGKSVVTAGICRWLVRQGLKVAPFKGQNMSLNSFVTREGAEIGRAQAMQAQAARVEPTALMNPVLLKPGSDRSSQVVLMGRPVGELSARGYHGGRQRELLEPVLACLEELRGMYDAVICEDGTARDERGVPHGRPHRPVVARDEIAPRREHVLGARPGREIHVRAHAR